MKTYNLPIFLVLICASFFSFYTSAQDRSTLNVNTYQLYNGLTVVLNQDTTTTQIFGAVLCKAGAKNEFPDATGMAHYLEHMLFKGTDQMGTWNYEKEKVHLDSINLLYELLAQTEEPGDKESLQSQINEQSVKATQYAVQSDFDKLLTGIGGDNVNAFTTPDMTFYYNSFPPQQIEKWLDLYVERFRNPVFRTFQSELEAVYEEKNRAMDDFENRLIEEMNKLLFPNLPYGQWTTLGHIEHLKKPSLTKMYDFYERFYVPENLVLILTGNFNDEEIKPLIQEKFSVLEKKEVYQSEFPELERVDGIEVTKKRLTPVKVGLMGFQTVPFGHKDRIALDVCEYILYNEGETGLINQLHLENKMMYAVSFSYNYDLAGSYLLIYVPKILTQSFKKAESFLEEKLEILKSGSFSDELFLSAKNEIYKDFQKGLESSESRAILIAEAYNRGSDWNETLQYPEKVNAVTKEDIVTVANRYFGENRVKLLSRTGFPKKVKLEKPPFQTVKGDQSKTSPYSEKFANIDSKEVSPKYIDFDQDITRHVLEGGHKIYASKNPVNDLFQLNFFFKGGSLLDNELDLATTYMNYVGTNENTLTEVKQKFSTIGCSYYFECHSNFISVSLEGKEENLGQALKLLHSIMSETQVNPKGHDILYSEIKTDRKLEKGYKRLMGQMLLDKARYGTNSEYLKRKPLKDIKGVEPQDWINTFKSAIAGKQADIMYSGMLDAIQVGKFIDQNISLNREPEAVPYKIKDRIQYDKTNFIVVNDKKSVQNQINFYVEGEPLDKDQYAQKLAFNEYFGYGLNSIVFQEIREFRALAYSSYFAYVEAPIPQKNGYLYGYIGCQADKTNEALDVMLGLLKNIPEQEEKFLSVKEGLKLKSSTSYPSFRELPEEIWDYERKGYEKDPLEYSQQSIDKLELDQVVSFYKETLGGKPITITIYGDLSKVDLEELKKMGPVTELKIKDIKVD